MLFEGDLAKQFPCLSQFTQELKVPSFEIQNRDEELRAIEAALNRPELCNVLLLGEPGSGKTALVQATMMHDRNRLYLEVDLSKMISDCNDVNEMATRLKTLCDEVTVFRREMETELVLFMDEFHQVMMLSNAAAEALKPLLADSGTRGVRIIAATTEAEFRIYIAPNQPLVERLQRIRLRELDRQATINVLKNRANMYGVADQFYNDSIYELIYEYTQRYIPANAQPRKSLLVLDAMIGWYRSEGRLLDKQLLADVIYESEGVNVTFKVDATSIKKELDKHVYAQDFATRVIEQRLQICVADLNNKSKPMSSFLFTGSTGVGKGLTDDTVVPVWTEDGSITEKLNGDLEIGDYVFNRKGEPVKVIGVYHRGLQDIYKVTLTDGRSLYTDSSHLWTYMLNKGKQTANTYTNSTKELYERGVYITNSNGRHKLKYWIPMNHAVQYQEIDLPVHPYVMGAFLGDGSLTVSQLTLSSSDEDLVAHVAELLGDCTYKHNHRNYNWTFPLNEPVGQIKSKQTGVVFEKYPEICVTAEKKHIPKDYMVASVEQRWELVKGLFDTDGSIGSADGGRYNVSYSTTSFDLANDVQQLLYSLGVASTISIARTANDGHYTQYRVNVKSSNENKDRFFWLARKVEIANKAKSIASRETKSHKKDYEWVGIAEIELLSEQKHTTCIMVDDEEHLYQAGQYVVSHNTEVTKQLAVILFGDNARTSLIRFDMTEYANDDSLERFRSELTARVWNHPYSIVLFDEIEKACAPVTRILLQVLDDGRLMDENNREVSFLNTYIVLTTNAGSEIYKTLSQYATDDSGSGKEMKKYDKLIRQSISSTTGSNRFPPELLGRIDTIVPFQPLSEATQKKIAKNKLDKLVKEVSIKHDVELSYDPKVIRYLVEDGLDSDSDSGGARRVISKLETEVTTAVARFINKYPNAYRIQIIVEGELAADNKTKLESEAYISIRASNGARQVSKH